jgi:hypothetical protein
MQPSPWANPKWYYLVNNKGGWVEYLAGLVSVDQWKSHQGMSWRFRFLLW